MNPEFRQLEVDQRAAYERLVPCCPVCGAELPWPQSGYSVPTPLATAQACVVCGAVVAAQFWRRQSLLLRRAHDNTVDGVWPNGA